jgi:transglutaminase-like putative cysteine protease
MYRSNHWYDEATRFRLRSPSKAESASAASAGERTFRLMPADQEPGERLEIWPNQPFGRVLFLPLGTAVLQVAANEISSNIHGIIEANDLPPEVDYTAWRTTATDVPAMPVGSLRVSDEDSRAQLSFDKSSPPESFDGDWRRLTRAPADLDPRIIELSARVVAGAQTDGEKIAAVQRYFLDNYEYQFGIEIPAGEDPLVYFLLQRPPAHCEYFASGAALLLRAAGVPCRYVTGFVATEANQYGGYWVARNRDAHAWVEALDHARGWVLVEATPSQGIPASVTPSASQQLWDSFQASWQRFVAAVRRDGIGAVAAAGIRLLKRPTTLVLVLLVAAAYAVARFFRRRRAIGLTEHDPIVIQLHKLLRQMDQRCGRRGFVRQPHETLHQFAHRIESTDEQVTYRDAADWYRNFAAIRYAGIANAEALRGLEEALASLPSMTVKSAATHHASHTANE